MRVIVADDDVLLREGVVRLLGEAGFDVVGQSATAEGLLQQVATCAPDVAILDIRMPPTQSDEGLRAALEIRAQHPRVGVMLLSQHADIGLAMKLLADDAEGVGYLLKDRISDVEEFAEAIRRVGRRGSVIEPSIVTQLFGRRRADNPLDTLSDREREVLSFMAEGRSNQGIAERLGISERGVQKHVTSIFTKLGLADAGDDHRRVLAVLAFLRT